MVRTEWSIERQKLYLDFNLIKYALMASIHVSLILISALQVLLVVVT